MCVILVREINWSEMVLLDGKSIDPKEIDSATCKFIGLFREPRPPSPHGANIICPCGNILETEESVFNHWQSGHFDIPQYQIIKDK